MNKFLEDWTKQLDDLKIQLDMDDTHVSEYFEKQKEKLTGFVEDAKERLDEYENSEQVKKLRGKLDDLQVQLALGRAETRDIFEAQKESLEHAMQEVTSEMREFEKKTGQRLDDRIDKFEDSFEKLSTNFKAKLDFMRVQYALGKADVRDEWDEARGEFKEKLQEIRTKLDEGKDDAEEKWEHFNEELSDAVSHLKKAVKGLFS